MQFQAAYDSAHVDCNPHSPGSVHAPGFHNFYRLARMLNLPVFRNQMQVINLSMGTKDKKAWPSLSVLLLQRVWELGTA